MIWGKLIISKLSLDSVAVTTYLSIEICHSNCATCWFSTSKPWASGRPPTISQWLHVAIVTIQCPQPDIIRRAISQQMSTRMRMRSVQIFHKSSVLSLPTNKIDYGVPSLCIQSELIVVCVHMHTPGLRVHEFVGFVSGNLFYGAHGCNQKVP